MKILKTLFLTLVILTTYSINAQVSITTDGSSADGSAMLDIKSTDKGMLIPRVALTGTTDVTTIGSPATSLMVYNTTTTGDVTPGFYYWNGTAWTTMAGNSSSSSHYVGELYGGGVVIYVDHTGQHGLILSMVNLSTSQYWSNVQNTLVGGTNVWDGEGNTANITGQSGHTNSAAKLCEDYTNADYGTGIYSDWYLPGTAELNQAWSNYYAVQKAIATDGNGATHTLSRAIYWSSTEYIYNAAWYYDFINGGKRSTVYKYTEYYVRAVRAF